MLYVMTTAASLLIREWQIIKGINRLLSSVIPSDGCPGFPSISQIMLYCKQKLNYMYGMLIEVNVDHLVTTHQGIDTACSSCLQQSLIEKVDW